MARRRLPQYLTFKGLLEGDEALTISARLCVQSAGATFVEVGPILTCRIPWGEIYDSEAANYLNRVHLRREQAEAALEAQAELESQEPLF